MLMKKFIAQLKGTKNRYGKPLAAKSVRNYMIPLHTIVRDALDEFGWDDMRDPFGGMPLRDSILLLPKKRATQIGTMLGTIVKIWIARTV